MKEHHQTVRHFEIGPNSSQGRNPRPEFIKAVRIVSFVLQERNQGLPERPEEKSRRSPGLIRSLALKAAILVPAVSYIACGGGGEDEKESPTSTFDNMPIPERKIDIDLFDERFDEKEEEKRVYIDTFRPARDRIEKLVLEIGPSFEPQIKTIYIPPPKPPQVEPVYPPPPEVYPGGGNKIVLTFDDSGPQAVSILDILGQYGAKAIFFPNGS